MEYIEGLKANIKILQDQYNKKLIPIRAITINSNKKEYYQDKNNINDFWKTKEIRFSTTYLLNLIENKSIVGFGIATGKDNNIIVIDWDNKETTNKDFINKLHQQNTLTISTPSGGFHFIFKFNELFKKNARGIFNNIDIRTNGGLIFHGIREDGLYNIYNNEKIKALDNDLIYELLNNIHQDNIISKETKKKDDTNKTNKHIDYDITDNDLFKLLDFLPYKYLDDFNEWLKLGHIFKKIDKYDIWDKWSKKNPKKYNKEKNKVIWDNMKENEKYNNDLSYLLWLIKYYNNDINIKKIEKIYKEYEEITQENLKDAKYIIQEYLNINNIDNNKKLNLIKSPTGSAKTTTAINYAKNERLNNSNIKIYSITHLITIADDHYNRFNEAGLKIFHYKEILGDFVSDDLNDDYDYCGGVVVVNSLMKFSLLDFSNSIIYLDEINAIIESLLNSSVIRNRREIINEFIRILNEAKIIIATDATISDLTYLFLKEALGDNEINFIINTYKNGNNTPCYFIEDFNKIEELIKDDLNNNKEFMGCFNSKRKTDDLNALIIRIKPEYKDNVIKITSSHGEKIHNVNEEWAGKISLFSPSIVQGIDYNPKSPINVYCFVYGDTTLNPIQISQQIARNRNPKNIYIYIEGCENKIYYKGGLNQIKKEYNNIKNINDTIYKDLLDTRTEGLKTIKEENKLTELFYKYKYNEDIIKSSFKYNLKTILKNKGCQIIDDLIYKKIEKSREEKKEIKETTRQIKEDEINKKFDDYLYNRLSKTDKYKCFLDDRIKALRIIEDIDNKFDYNDIETIKSYKEILNNDTLYKSFFNIIYYLCYNTESNDKKVIKRINDDFTHHTFKEIQTIIKTYKRLLITYTPNINPYYFSYNEIDYKDDLINITDDDYNIIKILTKTTRPKPKTTIDFLRLIKLIAKKIFGDIIKQTNHIIREKKTVNRYSSIVFNEKAFYKALYHIKYYSTSASMCPYIKSLINDDDFDNIDNKNIDINDLLLNDDDKSTKSTETETESIKSNNEQSFLLPYNKININLLIDDVKYKSF